MTAGLETDDYLARSKDIQMAIKINVNVGADQAAQKMGRPRGGATGPRNAMREEVVKKVSRQQLLACH